MIRRPDALISPAKSHPEVIIQAVAARDRQKAAEYARKHNIPQVMDSYDGVLSIIKSPFNFAVLMIVILTYHRVVSSS